MKNKPQERVSCRRRRGFSLTEIALCISIISIFMGTLLSTSGSLWGGPAEMKDVLREIYTVAANIQNQYAAVPMSSLPPGWTANHPVTTVASLLPGEMVITSTTYRHSFGGGFVVASDDTPGATPGGPTEGQFILILQGLKQTACVSLLRQLPLSDSGFGFVRVSVETTGATKVVRENTTYGGNGITWTPALPILVATAQGWCNDVQQNNEIDITYKIHP